MPEKKNRPREEGERDTAAETAVGTGVGAAGGGIAGAAIGTAVGGPVGTAVGAVIGAVAGGLAGAGIAEAVDTDAEDAYWRETHAKQPYAADRPYEHFAPAYRTGFEGYGKYEPGTKFEEAEPTLRQDYETWWREHTSPTTAGTKSTTTPAAPSWEEAKPASEAAWRRVERGEAARMQLSEEQVNVRKREIESGAVRLRKVVRIETVNQPVDLKREEIVVERVPTGTAGSVPENAFQEGEVTVPLKREEAVVEKSAHVTGEVRLKKNVEQETQNVKETVRKEDVKLEKEGEARIEPKRKDK